MMKRLMFVGLSLLTIAATAPVQAGELTATRTAKVSKQTTPANLVTRGYRGYLERVGIPSNHAFLSAIKTGEVDEKDLVKSGIRAGLLSPSTIDDASYIHGVRVQLKGFDSGD
ncbi:MAG: hypothetical protein ACFBSE_00200 [Prochloraceae cyanobacterium]